MAVSEDRFRLVFCQGHPEYDATSLLKEYKREVNRWIAGERRSYPPFPEHYLRPQCRAILDEHRDRVEAARKAGGTPREFPEELVARRVENTWHDTAEAVVGNWIGNVYQVTSKDRKVPFMEGVDPADPLGLRRG
jgi:homoserine O-succinyltransferase